MTKTEMIKTLIKIANEKRPYQVIEEKKLQKKNKKYIQNEIDRYQKMAKKGAALGSPYLAEAHANM